MSQITSLNQSPAPLLVEVSSEKAEVSIVDEKVQESAHARLSTIDQYEQELLGKYNDKAVHALMDRVRELGKETLTDDDKDRFEIFCHYFDIECSFKEKIHKEHSPEARLLKHYLKYTQREVQYRLKHTYRGETLTHENIELCKKNIETFLAYLEDLLETFEELQTHKALTKVPVLPSEILTGEAAFMDIEAFKSAISEYFKDELSIREQLESLSMEELTEIAEELKEKILHLRNYKISQELLTKLALKIGKTAWLAPLFPERVIQGQASLFEACRLGEQWADDQEELTPIPGSGGQEVDGHVNLNFVYFLKDPRVMESAKNIAVFKDAIEASSLETLVYDAAVIFGVESAFVPTKLKKIKDKSGSIQIFQDALSWTDFCELGTELTKTIDKEPITRAPQSNPAASLPQEETQSTTDEVQGKTRTVELEEVPAPETNKVPTRVSTEDLEALTESQRTNLQDEIINSISMEDFLKAGLGAVLFGNRDLHVGNFFFKQKEDGNYSIVMFDNEMSFFHSNYVLLDSNGNCHLPHRNSLLIFPHADVPITGPLRENVRRFVNSFETRYQEFLNYLDSASGKNVLKNMRHQELGYYPLKAFKRRIEKLTDLVNSDKAYSYRDMVYTCFPLFEAYLSLVEILYPDKPEMMVGYHPAEELCNEVIKLGYMTEEKKEAFIEEIKKYEYK